MNKYYLKLGGHYSSFVVGYEGGQMPPSPPPLGFGKRTTILHHIGALHWWPVQGAPVVGALVQCTGGWCILHR